MAREVAKAIRSKLKTSAARRRLRGFIKGVAKSDVKAWKRGKAVLGYLEGQSVIDLAAQFDVTRGSVNRWLQWYNTMGLDGLRTVKPPGRPPRLSSAQRSKLAEIVEAGPQSSGFDGGVWTGPMIGEVIRQRFDIKYHNHHIPRLLHDLGFSVQRPRKRLARANARKQKVWVTERLPYIKKKARRCRGVVIFEDEASFWVDGTLHQTWSRVGVQPRVDTFGQRKTAHLFGAIALDDASFTYRFADKFNNSSFLTFLKHLVTKYAPRKIFLIIDNAPHHNLNKEGKDWLAANKKNIELHRLPPYSPEFMPMEGVWKATRKCATHNRFYKTPEHRDAALRRTFKKFQTRPQLIAAHVERFA
jgi:transposase